MGEFLLEGIGTNPLPALGGGDLGDRVVGALDLHGTGGGAAVGLGGAALGVRGAVGAAERGGEGGPGQPERGQGDGERGEGDGQPHWCSVAVL